AARLGPGDVHVHPSTTSSGARADVSDHRGSVRTGMVGVAWTAIALLAATLLGTLWHLGGRIDALGARIDGLDARIDQLAVRIDGLNARIDGLGGRIDALGARLDARIDALSARIDAHLQQHRAG
ncbi:MAG TPA: hypothetical protein VNO79_03055, partial [Actinomycetota bacterium]|nr:hypothetical protein [Actinomycetota bacterium]